MTLSLFYNSQDGSGAIANITSDGVATTKVYPKRSFGFWTHIVEINSGTFKSEQEIFFYNRNNGEGIIGTLKEDGFMPTGIFPPGSFDTWTHITAVGSLLFFYDKYSGAAAIASTEPETVKMVRNIDPHISTDLNKILVPRPNDFSKNFPELVSGFKLPGNNHTGQVPSNEIVTITSFNRGSFNQWTHVVVCGRYLLFYNEASGAASVSKIDTLPLTKIKDFVVGAKAIYRSVKDYAGIGAWTHIASGPPYLFFYNEKDGSAMISEINDLGLTTVIGYKAGSFGDWTHLSSQGEPFLSISKATVIDPVGGFPGTIAPPKIETDNVVLFYNARSGAGALGVLENKDLKVTKGFKEGSFGTWTAISDPSTAIDPQDLGYKLIRTGSGVRIMNYDGTFTDVDVLNSDLSPEQQQAAIDQIYDKMEAFIKRNADAIASGDIKAEDIGGELYGIASGVIVAIFAPFAGVPLLDELIAKPFEEASKNAGRYYGAAVDDLVDTLKKLLNNAEGKPRLSQILGTMATVYLMGKYVPGATVGGADAWSLTKQIGSELGGAVEDTLNSAVDVAGDALKLGADAAAAAADFVGGLLGF